MKIQLSPWQKDLAALLAGGLLTLAFAPFEIFPFAVVALAILLGTWLRATPWRAWRRGFLFGIGLFGTGVSWVFTSVHVYGDAPLPFAILVTTGFIMLLALFPAYVGYLLNRFFPYATPVKTFCAFPALWVLSEWLRSFIFSGFPWLLIGYSQTNSPLKGFAPILSVFGVSLAVLWSSALLVNAFSYWKQQQYSLVYRNLLAFALLWILGSGLCLIHWTKPNGDSLHVSLVQGNIPQEMKWSPESVQFSLERYFNLTEPLWEKDKLIIWPETAIPLTLQQAEPFVEELDQKARSSQSTLMTGIPVHNPSGDGYYNALITLGAKREAYLKHRLVPFGEYLPLPKLIQPIVNYLHIPMSDMIPGTMKMQPFIVNGIKILPFICYEIAFPEQVLSRDKTIGMLLTVNNDAWFGDSPAQAQHLQMARMRAIEMGRPGLFVSNDGITAIIAPNGNIQAIAPAREPYVLTDYVQPMQGRTPWQRYAMDPILIIAIALLISAFRLRHLALRREL